jgi:hypothetical protein
MIEESEILKPVHMIGAFCMVAAVGGILVFFSIGHMEVGFQVFVFVNVLFHLLTGFGIWFRTSWGFYLLKFYLYYLLLCIPIGTYIARRVLSHIRENDIQRYFGSNTIEL